VDEICYRGGVKTKAGLRDVSDKAGAGSVVGIVELAVARRAVALAGKKMALVLRREKGAQMMIEPPGYARRSAVLKIYDCVLITDKIRLLKKRSGSMHQSVIAVFCIWRNALVVEAHEERSGTRSVKAPVVIENADIQTGIFLAIGRMIRIAGRRLPVKLPAAEIRAAMRQ
jgi:hypothetical protein